MDNMLGELDVYILVYLDNILIHSAMAEDHTKYTRAVFEHFSKSKLYLKQRKYTFFLLEVKVLGHMVSEHGVSVSPGKVSSILDWPLSSFIHYIKAFLGL